MNKNYLILLAAALPVVIVRFFLSPEQVNFLMENHVENIIHIAFILFAVANLNKYRKGKEKKTASLVFSVLLIVYSITMFFNPFNLSLFEMIWVYIFYVSYYMFID